jgi:hypothetical protein
MALGVALLPFTLLGWLGGGWFAGMGSRGARRVVEPQPRRRRIRARLRAPCGASLVAGTLRVIARMSLGAGCLAPGRSMIALLVNYAALLHAQREPNPQSPGPARAACRPGG